MTLQSEIGANAKDKGFWNAHREMLDSDPHRAIWWIKLGLISTEVAEAMEELREAEHLSLRVNDEGKLEGLPSELADIVIRCLDAAEWAGFDLMEIVRRKHEYNTGRDPLHGKKA